MNRDFENSFVSNAVALTGKKSLIVEVVRQTGKAYKSTPQVLQDLFLYEDGQQLEGSTLSPEPGKCSQLRPDGDVKPRLQPSAMLPAKDPSSGTTSMPSETSPLLSQAATITSPGASSLLVRSGSQNLGSMSTVSGSKATAAETRELRRLLTCKICLEELVCITFVPCGHLVSCAECAPALQDCPICRKAIRGTVKTVM